jgi:hypothetical protein
MLSPLHTENYFMYLGVPIPLLCLLRPNLPVPCPILHPIRYQLPIYPPKGEHPRTRNNLRMTPEASALMSARVPQSLSDYLLFAEGNLSHSQLFNFIFHCVYRIYQVVVFYQNLSVQKLDFSVELQQLVHIEAEDILVEIPLHSIW